MKRAHQGSRNTQFSKNFSVDLFLQELKTIYFEQPSEWMFFCRKTVMSLSKKRLKTLGLEFFSKTRNDTDPFPNQIIEVMQDLIDFKLYRPNLLSKSKFQPKVFMKIYFHNKGIEKVNLPQLMKKVKKNLPSTFRYKDIPTIIYKRSPTIARKIFNYKQSVTTLDCKQWLTSEPVTCDCKTSVYCDPHHQHILTGNLGLMSHPKLSLLCKGPKFGERKE